MKLRDLDRPLLNVEGKEFEDKGTLRKVLITACLAADPEERESADKKYKVGMLAFRLQKAQKSVILTAEEVSMVKERVGKFFPPLVIVRIFDAVEDRKPAEEQVKGDIDQDEEDEDELKTKRAKSET